MHQPTWKWLTTHKEKIWNIWSMWKWEFILMYKIHCHFGTRLENHKKDNQNHVCILLHREALSVIRCVLLQAYSYWYLLQNWEKRSTLSSNGNPFMYISNTLYIYATDLKKPLFQDGLKWGITKTYWGPVKWNPSTTFLHQVKNYADTREVNI